MAIRSRVDHVRAKVAIRDLVTLLPTMASWKRYCKQMTTRCPYGTATVPSTQFYVTGDYGERTNRTPLDHIASIWETSFHRGDDWQRKTSNETVPHTYMPDQSSWLSLGFSNDRSIDRSTQLIGEATDERANDRRRNSSIICWNSRRTRYRFHWNN